MNTFIFWFFFKKFMIGMAAGALLRLIIALVLRSDMTLKGLFRTSIITAIIYVMITYYMVVQI